MYLIKVLDRGGIPALREYIIESNIGCGYINDMLLRRPDLYLTVIDIIDDMGCKIDIDKLIIALSDRGHSDVILDIIDRYNLDINRVAILVARNVGDEDVLFNLIDNGADNYAQIISILRSQGLYDLANLIDDHRS
jgi:hypothetical protein